MKGAIRTKERCPKCGGKFSGEPLVCPACLTHPNKYYIVIYARNYGTIKLYSDQRGESLRSWEKAERVLVGIRNEIDQRKFDPTRYAKKELKAYLFETQIEAWYKGKTDEVSLGNLAGSYVRSLRRYKDEFYLRHFKGLDVREIRTFIIDEFYRKLPRYFELAQRERNEKAEEDGRKTALKKSWSLKYIRNVMSALESFFTSMYELERIERPPVFPEVTIDRKTPKWSERAVQIEILAAIPEEDRDIFAYLAFQGIRPGEARALKVKDFDLADESFRVERTYSDRVIVERTKGKTVRPRAINPVLLPMLTRLCEGKHPEAFIFINPRTGKPYSEDVLFVLWDAARKAKGLDLTLYQATRHSFASNLVKDGVDISIVSKLLGHTDIRTTMVYAHADLSTQKVAFKKQGAVLSLVPNSCPADKTAEKK